ncbi:MAG: 16S rRNA (cytosine(1402)-N(4))-methyltransferase RsmH [Candidatus Cloacimonetes bacterium]|nr:16S rRNA (cytosine(1402)-N(4))-methyltransferase RsmH [Candidatus Cloacimonadota bacterium]MCF7814116.1 16S rRNA (cytosine(1402)-N(4))-methyltransferase RsmH [Candidatus Cloacimonadota bacterium]MCF7868735.1 16S rRNA (cytosine(1402)-N(4))-methyltransferase RsmH [Candidatus Cloacimonadota bacterium]MCF7884115.1 16S rRNA (cytosine(1402)-N(4))-methyltransferase RsmH [Candidatus Cloacimonadota bacterium]
MSSYHVPVLLDEAIDALQIKPGGIYIDATLGGGGHTQKILQTNDQIHLFSFDQDEESLKQTKPLVQKYSNLTIIKENFANLRTCLALERIKKIDGILFDLGVSSHQINAAERGFSFSLEGKLDMRMNAESDLTAFEIINKFEPKKLKNIFLEYGEEKEAFKIAREIAKAREIRQIETTLELAQIIDRATSSKKKIKAKARIFQALRIYINGEIEVLKTALSDAVKILNPGSRIVVISYHSLEDRIVKKFFQNEELDCVCPNGFLKCVCDKESTLKIITRKPLLPSEDEISRNPRARSAKMRIAERKEEV